MKYIPKLMIAASLVWMTFYLTSCFFGTSSGSSGNSSSSFSRNLSLEGVSFQVNSNYGQLTVQPSGFQDNSRIQRQIDGIVKNAEIWDLNNDGAPELLIYTSSGNNQRGEVIAYTSYGRSSVGEVYVPELDYQAGRGYEGYDTYGITDGWLVRTFPVYQNGNRTGATREIKYRMVNGENSRVFRIESVNDFYN